MATKARASVISLGRLRVQRIKGLEARYLARKPFLGDASMIHLRLPARTALPLIQHRRTNELIYVLAGSMAGWVGTRRYALKAGSVVYIPAGAWHKFETRSRACEALAMFHPELVIDRWADIHSPPGVSLWD